MPLQVEQLESRFVPSHVPLGPEFIANDIPLQGPSRSVAIASDAVGGFVVAWAEPSGDGQFDVKARLFNRDGVPLPNDQGQPTDILVADDINQPNQSEGRLPVTVDVAMTPDGGFVVVYDTNEFNDTNFVNRIHAHYYSSSAQDLGNAVIDQDGSIFEVNSPSISRDDAGNAYVAFLATLNSGSFGGNTSVFVQKIDASASLVGGRVAISPEDLTTISPPSIGAESDGDYVVSWDARAGGSTPSVVFRRFAADGTAVDASPVVVAALADPNGFTRPSVGRARLTGDFVVTWTDVSAGQNVVLAQRFNPDGSIKEAVFQVNTDAIPSLVVSSVAVDASGNFVVAWSTGQNTSIFFRTFFANGQPDSSDVKVNSAIPDFGPVDVAVNADFNQFVLDWSGGRFSFTSDPVDPSTGLDPTLSSFFAVGARIYRLPDKPPLDMPNDMPMIPPAGPDPTPFLLPDGFAFPPGAMTEFTIFFPADVPVFVPAARPAFPVNTFPETLFLTGGSKDVRMGEIGGRVYLDVNGNGLQEDGEPGFAGQRVFLDYNGNGILDEGEPVVETDPDGRYLFTGLALTRYEVRQVLRPSRILQTVPERSAPHVVDLSWDNSSVAGRDFGTKVVTATMTDAGTPAPEKMNETTPTPPPK